MPLYCILISHKTKFERPAMLRGGFPCSHAMLQHIEIMAPDSRSKRATNSSYRLLFMTFVFCWLMAFQIASANWMGRSCGTWRIHEQKDAEFETSSFRGDTYQMTRSRHLDDRSHSSTLFFVTYPTLYTFRPASQ